MLLVFEAGGAEVAAVSAAVEGAAGVAEVRGRGVGVVVGLHQKVG